MQKQCYCEQLNSFDSFSCFICKKSQHWQCYDYQITDKQPTQLRCLSCTLNANNPFLQFENYVRLNNKLNVFTLKKTAEHTEKTFSFDVNRHFDELKKKQIILAIFCTKLKDAKKLYEWPSKNVYLELNGQHHIEYNTTDYGFIPSTCIQWGLNTIKFKLDDKLEFTSVFGVAIFKNIRLSEIRARILDVGREKLIDQIITQQKQQYEDKIKSLLSKDDSIKSDALISIKLIDGLTQQQLEIPVRGKNCVHFDCFELNSYLIYNEKPNDARWKCPLCNQQVPLDMLQIDYVLAEILHDLKITYPSIYHKLQRVQLNQHLEYKLDEQLEAANSMKTKLYLSQALMDVIEINQQLYERSSDSIIKFIQEFQRKDNYQTNFLTIKSAKKMLEKFKQKDVYKNQITHPTHKQTNNNYDILWYSKHFFEIFCVKDQFKVDLFEDIIALQYFEQLQDFELICKLIQNKTPCGLFIYFLRLFSLSVQKMSQILSAFFVAGKLYLFPQTKILEMILAFSYEKKTKISLGCQFKNLCVSMDTKKDDYYNMIVFLSQKLRSVFYNTDQSGFFIVRNCINLCHMFDMLYLNQNGQQQFNIDDYQLTIKLIKEVYSLEIIKQNPNVLEILRLILFLLSKKEKKLENITDSFQEYQLGDLKVRFRNMDYYGEYCYL